jgi:hypothetical protein
MSSNGGTQSRSALISPIAIATIAIIVSQSAARADEGGVSFWLPGQFGSLAAVPAQPGWSFANVVYLTDVRASGAVAAARQVTIGRFNPAVNVDLNVNLHARVAADFVNATYGFATPVLGGQLAVGMTGAFGYPTASLDGTLTASVGGITATRSGTISDGRQAVGDLYPTASLRWNQGVHNFMIYGMGDIPVGTYDPGRLANLGIGHGAADGGFGYTYFNPQSGYEFSAVTGLTYNFRNTHTDYQNGLNLHFDWGASKFLSPQMFVGLVGYMYQQVTPDSGQAAFLGDFKSRVFAVGPQVGFIFPMGDMQGYLNLKGYHEFAAQNRPGGWNAWVTLAISPAEKPAPSPLARIQK